MHKEDIQLALLVCALIALVGLGLWSQGSVKCQPDEVKVKGQWSPVCVKGNYGR